MKIKVTKFAARQFDKKFGATKILNYTVGEFEIRINNEICFVDDFRNNPQEIDSLEDSNIIVINGYAPFCKLIPIKNFTDARVGSLPITLENYQYLRSGYSARTDLELPVFSRWFELPLSAPKAKYLMLVLYSKEQIEKEWEADLKKKFDDYEKNRGTILTEKEKEDLKKIDAFKYEFEGVDYDWGVVAILGQGHNEEEMMKPETMIRNALGIEEGGSGVKLDREKYLESVKFWNCNATVK